MDEKPSVQVFIPPLALILEATEQKKGSALTRDEVIAIRDKAPCLLMTEPDAAKFMAGRGSDIDGEQPWESWQQYRSRRQPPNP
jgi:hypothetical protein